VDITAETPRYFAAGFVNLLDDRINTLDGHAADRAINPPLSGGGTPPHASPSRSSSGPPQAGGGWLPGASGMIMPPATINGSNSRGFIRIASDGDGRPNTPGSAEEL